MYEQFSIEYNIRWQQRIVNTNFVAATVVLVFEIAYYFILTAIGLRDQTTIEYILIYILMPAGVIFTSCTIGWFIVNRSEQSPEVKSLAAMLAMVALCATGATVHNIFATTLCSFFVPLSISVVFGKRHITNIVGCCCVVCELIAMCFAGMDLRGKDPYFMLDCLMLFIVFGISWYATLLLMKNDVVLLPGVSTIECIQLLNRLLVDVATSPLAELEGVTLSLSGGVTHYDFCTPVLDAIDSSDQAMYKAKTSGKNRCVVA